MSEPVDEIDVQHLPICSNCGGYWGKHDVGWCGPEEMFVMWNQYCPRWIVRDPDVLDRFRPTLWLKMKTKLKRMVRGF